MLNIQFFFFKFVLQGYALFGNVVCLFLTTIGYHHSHSFFYALWLVFGGLSAAKLVSDLFLSNHVEFFCKVLCDTDIDMMWY